MPRNTKRKVRHERLIQVYFKYIMGRRQRLRQRITQQQYNLQAAGLAEDSQSETSSAFSPSSVGSLGSQSSSCSISDTETSSDSESDSRGDSEGDSGSSHTSVNFEEEILFMEVDQALEGMPDLLPAGYPDSDDDWDSDDSDSESDDSTTDEELGNEGDDEELYDTEGIGSDPRLARYVRNKIKEMYSHRYEEPRNIPISHPPPQMPHILRVTKIERPDQFREILRVNPTTFDKIVGKIQDDPIFYNESNNPQIPVEEQLAITLYRFGHDGNAASKAEVARWAGGGRGSPALHTKQVMTAILRRSFMDEAVRFPTMEEKTKAKAWVEAHSCRAWRHGWLFVDGTLIPLFDRPYWYGESYFDRKCNYSLNIQVCKLFNMQFILLTFFVQIVSLPNLRIVDFSYGHTGSAHDSTAWDETRLAREHDTILDEGEFVWADSAYPVSLIISRVSYVY